MRVVAPFGGGNRDGTGVAYSEEGRIIIKKYPAAFFDVVKNRLDLFNHMPSKTWTIFHVRLATHGEVCYKNTHPFLIDQMAFVHNGVYQPYNIVKSLLGERYKLASETDSEVGAAFLRMIGPDKFIQANERIYGGVFLGLTPTGGLWTTVLSGDLEYAQTKNGTVIASKLPSSYKDAKAVDAGFMIFEKNGDYRRGNFTTKKIWTYNGGKWDRDHNHWWEQEDEEVSNILRQVKNEADREAKENKDEKPDGVLKLPHIPPKPSNPSKN